MSFWDRALARTVLIAPLAIVSAMAFMLGIERSTYLSTGEFVGSVVALSLALSFAVGLIVVGLNASWWVLRPEDRG